MPGRADYEERRQERIDRLNGAAERESSRAGAEFQRSHDLVAGIPFGQPNIEGRPALPRLRERSMNAMDRGMKHSEKAGEYARRAEAAENNTAISSDDPRAIEKLEAKIAAMRENQAAMKAINKYYRKNKSLDGCPELTPERKADILSRWKMGWYTEVCYPPYELSNLNQRIKAAEKRIASLRRVDDMEEETIPFDGGEIVSDPDTNRIAIYYNMKPDREMISRLKGNGFRWSPSMGAWTRLRNPAALRAARRICHVANAVQGVEEDGQEKMV